MLDLASKLRRDASGATTVEYVLIASFAAIALAFCVLIVGA